jgi:hypothetical protein
MTPTTAHSPWCDHKEDDSPVHECHASLDMNLRRYPPVQQASIGDFGAVTWQVRPHVSVLLSHASLGSAPYIELALHDGDDDQSVDLTTAEAAQLAAALSLLAAKAGTIR